MEEEIKTKIIYPENPEHDPITVIDFPHASTLNDSELAQRIAVLELHLSNVLHPEHAEIELKNNIPGQFLKFDRKGIEHGFELWYYYSDRLTEAQEEQTKRRI